MRHAGADHVHALYAADAFDVRHLQVPTTPLAEAFVRLMGLVRHHEAGVGGKALELFLQFLLDALPAAYQRHEHKDAPEYAEGREQASGLVSGDGEEDFLHGVSIYLHINLPSMLLLVLSW